MKEIMSQLPRKASVARMKRSGIRDNKPWIPARRASIQATYLQNPVILPICFYG